MHFAGDVPSPAHALVSLPPRNQIVHEQNVQHPVVLAPTHVFVLEEEWTGSTKQDHDLPEEKQSCVVQRGKPDESIENQSSLAARVVAVVLLHQQKKLIAAEEGTQPEKHIDCQVCGEHDAEKATFEPFFDCFQVLKR